MKVSDYIWEQLAAWGIRHAFMVTGGGAMFLDDSLGRNQQIEYTCCLHEQACAIAAEGYARIKGRPAVVCVTTGPGGTNTLTGVLGAWIDSIPMFVISGQIKRSTMVKSYPGLKLRQLGDQEYDIVSTVKPMTKFAATIMSVDDVQKVLKKAWIKCRSGRPGPVWVDVPLDIQSAECDFKITGEPGIRKAKPHMDQVKKVAEAIQKAKRPVFLVGYGLRNSGCLDQFISIAELLNVPVLTSISGIDAIRSDHRLFYGRPGILGERPANFIMQNSDCLIVIGARMGIRICSYAYDDIARGAIKIMVDVDDAELNKPTFKPDIKVRADAGEFLTALKQMLPSKPIEHEWIKYCDAVKAKYPVVTTAHRHIRKYVSSYVFPEKLSKYVGDNGIIVTSNGTAYTSTFQALPIKENMRVFSNQGCASMGYGLPAAIGAAIASGRQIVCLEGDGSLQMNVQELQTVKTYGLHLKIFVYNNAGYLSMKITQDKFFGGRLTGADASSGVKLPSIEKIAAAFGYDYIRIDNNTQIDISLKKVFSSDASMIIEVMTDPFEVLGPKASSKKLDDGRIVSLPLEDMSPLLSREEFLSNMLIKPVKASFQARMRENYT